MQTGCKAKRFCITHIYRGTQNHLCYMLCLMTSKVTRKHIKHSVHLRTMWFWYTLRLCTAIPLDFENGISTGRYSMVSKIACITLALACRLSVTSVLYTISDFHFFFFCLSFSPFPILFFNFTETVKDVYILYSFIFLLKFNSHHFPGK